ncbi:MAG: phosphate acyltransferase PlsX [Melioribacteraceae bacterium]|nr:phosphate acyltransferase PlsX [Melioribacteraceae bacterium]MCF8264435.1 phosphate acyltransferase PlsX [Melioribacteraceae bacterium]MCF8413056.1 phosphate acyltransferase PlsX [Melioribacteraceae bacterium]
MNQEKSKNCRVIVDAMGGDYAPRNAVIGAVQASSEFSNSEIYLVGKRNEIENVLKTENLSFDQSRIIDASEVIEMSDSPTSSIKAKKDSSIVIGLQNIKEGKADAFVSAGNTGACSAASTLMLGRIKGISRPTIMASFPNQTGGFTAVADVGAFVDSKPQHLLDYAILSSIYIEEIFQKTAPSVGLLNVGEERGKGYKLTAETFELLKNSGLNFTGNVEGNDIFKGSVDIVICDGFVGNIVLKFAESIMPFLKGLMRNYADKSLLNKVQAGIAKGPLKAALKNTDYQTHGGVPLLGLNAISIIGHGSSSPLAIKNMVLRAIEMHDKNLIKKFEEAIGKYGKT